MLKKIKHYLPRKDHSLQSKIWRYFVLFLGGTGSLALLFLLFLAFTLPSAADLEKSQTTESTEIYDRDGKLLYTIHGEENREEVPYNAISKNLINATVAIEDDRFWKHGGFDLGALGMAVLSEIGFGKPRGGSTITQQYVKNAILSPERTYTRKIKELILAMRLESAFDKEKILELYLNRIPYGNNAYGAQKAAEIYFNKDAKDLTVAESAILASLPQAPSRFNPYGDNLYSHLLREFSEKEVEKIKNENDLVTADYSRGLIGQEIPLVANKNIYIQGRSDLVLKRMYELKMISATERKQALNEIQKMTFERRKGSIEHPHFILYIRQLLENRYGKDVVEGGGLKVYTTLDQDLQRYAEEIAFTQGEKNAKTVKANNVAILTIKAQTGEILAMVGSRDYFNEEIDGNVNVVFRPRQPGSAFKPLIYAQAFYQGYGPGTVIDDIPTKIGKDQPQNFDGKWLGRINIREALGRSRNIPAIKAYYLAGKQDAIIPLAKKMGINSLKENHSYGYPLALGAGEVSLAEMVNTYAVFANQGKKPELNPILKVVNQKGKVLEEFDPENVDYSEILDPQIAYLISDILADKSVSIGSYLFVAGKTVAAKTGTSTKENKKTAGKKTVSPSDGWTIGYTPDIVTGVWIGNTDGSGMGFSADGYNNAAPIFNKIMTKALEKTGDKKFPRPEGIKDVKISKLSGLLPGPDTPEKFIETEKFASFAVPTKTENLYTKVKIDKLSGLLATEFTPEDAVEEITFVEYKPIANLFNWSEEARDYYAKNPPTIFKDTPSLRFGTPPTEYSTTHSKETATKKPTIKITSPASQTKHDYGTIEVNVSIDAPLEIDRVEYYLDDKKTFFTQTAPYTGYITLSRFLKKGETYLIIAKVIDKLGYSNSAAIEIRLGGEEMTSEGKPDAKLPSPYSGYLPTD